MEIRINDRQRDWKWYMMLGVLLAIVGIGAMAFATYTSVFSAVFFGALLAISGVAHLYYSFKFRSWGWVLLHLAMSVLQLVTGALLMGFPLAGIAALTLVVSIYLLVGGVFRIIFGLTNQVTNGQWIIISGFASSVLGLIVWMQWPLSSLWFFGTAIGIDLMLDGAQWITRGLEIKNTAPPLRTKTSPRVA